MNDTAEDRRIVLRRARRALESGAELPPDLPDTIRCSWTRSRLAAAPLDRIAVPYLAAGAAAERLLRAARPVLDRFAQQLVGTHVSLVLADPDGRVVGRWAGDQSQLRRLARVSIEEGYVLAEELAGTNGVGTALEVLAPVTIVGAEHYAEPLHGLVCAGVPIRHPLTGRLEGVLDLACPTADANGLLMPATLDLAVQIEREMSMGAPERERIVFDTFVARSRVTSAALVALSEHYMVTNAAAADLLEPRDEACLWQQALESLTAGRPVTRPMQLSGGSTITARCTPIMTGAHPVGALIEVAAAPSRTTGRRPRHRGQGGRPPRQSRATARFERDLAEAVRGPARTILLEGEPGSGRLFAARRVHQLRGEGTSLVVHPAGVAQAQGGQQWLADLARRLADRTVTAAVTDLDLLDERTQRGFADLLAGQAAAPLVLMTGQAAADEPGCWAAAGVHTEVTVHVPALRQRREDLPELAHSLLRASGVTSRVGYRAMTALTNHAWPGNVSQLKRVLAGAAHAAGGTDIRPEHLGRDIYISPRGRRTLTRLEALERDAIVEALRECGGNRIQAAAALGMSRSTLYRRLQAFGLEPGRTVL
ncbi:MAG TPA: helix-turn-helix domain-containing protein [Streptosporangiaceae bacterium]|nr:helix-turn-helix domain-containing protein [Streptosporangiaceae bacterium]